MNASNIFSFNHISKDLPVELEQTLKEFYKFYYKKWWCYNKTFKRYKNKSLSLTILSAGSIISGAVAGGVSFESDYYWSSDFYWDYCKDSFVVQEV